MSNENNIPLENAPTTPQWETMDAWVFTRFFATVRGVFFHPVQFFKSFRADGDYLAPLLYVLLLYIMILPVPVVIGVSMLFELFDYYSNAGLFGNLFLLWAYLVAQLFHPAGMPLITIPLFLFVSAGIIHLLAILLGAASKPYKATFRIMAYLFTINLLLFTFIGAPLAVICQAVYLTIALREVHHTTTFRAACVVLPPILLALLLFMWFLYTFFLPLSRGMFFSY